MYKPLEYESGSRINSLMPSGVQQNEAIKNVLKNRDQYNFIAVLFYVYNQVFCQKNTIPRLYSVIPMAIHHTETTERVNRGCCAHDKQLLRKFCP